MVPPPPAVRLSVVAPAHDEQDNVEALIEEIESALEPGGLSYEIIIVDDGSTDRTGEVLRAMRDGHPRLRVLSMRTTPTGRGSGQSAAFHAGFRAARGEWVATLDADRQNDPADLPAMLERLETTGADLVQGDRSSDRRDSATRRLGSWVGRIVRRAILGDTIRDTGCSLRVMRREIALAVPLEFSGIHRFIPITAKQMGFAVVEMPVHHRPRVAGETKYGMWDRALVGLYDCLSVRWMARRRRSVEWDEVD